MEHQQKSQIKKKLQGQLKQLEVNNNKIKRSTSLQEKTEEKDRDYEDTNSVKSKLVSKGRVPVKVPVAQKTEVKKQSSESRPRLDLSKKSKEERDHFDTILRIRDPVTSKVRTINLKDNEIDELARRHEEEKNKISRLMKNESHENRQNGLETVKEVNSVPESYRSTQAQQTSQRVVPQPLDEVDELINRHQREKINAQQIKTNNDTKKQDVFDLNETHNKNHDDHFDDIEI